MATILLLDPSEVAGKAMQGILAHGRHQLVTATTIADAWQALHEHVIIDLIFSELELKGEKGLAFLSRLRSDCFLKAVPVVIYSNVNDMEVVRKVLSLKVQNFLIKPYSEECIFREIGKASANPWRKLQFEEEISFCTQMGCSIEDLRRKREDLMDSLSQLGDFLATGVESGTLAPMLERLNELSNCAELCGVWDVVAYMDELKRDADKADWGHFKRCGEDLKYARQLIALHLNPNQKVVSELTAEEKEARAEAEARAVWMNANVDLDGPMVSGPEVQLQVEALPACPVIDSVAAAFLMTTEQSSAGNLNQVNDLVNRDPGLVTQVLIAANQLEHDEMTSIEDPHTAVSLLGNLKLNAISKILPTVPERHVQLPALTWADLWMFQVGVGRVAHYTAKYLEFELVDNWAETSGLLHDVGRLLLLKLFPFAFPAAVAYAHEHNVSPLEAEKKYLGCSSREMGEWFARKNLLPAPYCHVIRWIEEPDLAPGDIELVGVVALARHICMYNHVGSCGYTSKRALQPLHDTAAWRVLQPRVFPSFNLIKFSTQVKAFCTDLKQTLSGQIVR